MVRLLHPLAAIAGGLALAVAPVLALAMWDEDGSHDPSYLLRGGLAGTWSLDRRNAEGGAVPDGFERFDVRMRAAPGGAQMDGLLTDARGREHPFDIDRGARGLNLLFSSSSTGCGWQDRISVYPETFEDPADDQLHVAFEQDEGGCVWPHSFERIAP